MPPELATARPYLLNDASKSRDEFVQSYGFDPRLFPEHFTVSGAGRVFCTERYRRKVAAHEARQREFARLAAERRTTA